MNSLSVRALLEEATRALGSAARLEAEVLLTHALQCSRSALYAHADVLVGGEKIGICRALVAARADGQPLAYLLGEREFWSLSLQVTPDTLIPRHDTEILVEQALLRLPHNIFVEIADFGTGSGAVALALAKERPQARVVATDISVAALSLAQINATRLQLTNVDFAQSDWYHQLQNRRFDMIVSNPPYIAASDPHLSKGDLRFEPKIALVSGVDGLDDLRKIIRDAPTHLRVGGWLLLEHGYQQAAAVRELLTAAGFCAIFSACDLEQRERVSGGHIPRLPRGLPQVL